MSALDLCVRVAAAWAVATALAWLLRKRSATLRHALWLGVLLVPFVPPIAACGRTVVGWVAARGGGEAESWRARWMVALGGAAHGGDESRDDATALAHEAAHDAALHRGEPPNAPWERTIAAAAPLAGWIALLGALLWAGVEARRAWRRRALARRGRLAPVALLQQVEALARQLRVTPPQLRLVDAIASPGVIGVLRPLLLLPASLVEPRTARPAAPQDAPHEALPVESLSVERRDLAPILVHELLHLRRRDPWTAAFATLARTLLWFHPCVWHAAARLARERELAVDEAVLLEGAIPAMDYAKSLIEVAAHAVDRRAPRPAVALSNSAQRLHERIERLLRTPAERAASPSQAPRRTDRLTRAVAGALLLAIVACGAASSTQSSGGGAATSETGAAATAATDAVAGERALIAAITASGIELPSVPAGGIAIARGGVALLVVVGADSKIAAPIRFSLPDDGRGFAVPQPIEISSDAPPAKGSRIEVLVRPPTRDAFGASVDGVRAATPDALVDLVAAARAAARPGAPLFLYWGSKFVFAPSARSTAALTTAFPDLSVVYPGCPIDMNEGPQIQAELAKLNLSTPLAGDVLIAADAGALTSSVAQVMQAFGARNHGRLAFVARRGEEWVKFSLYLPMDGGVGK
ncbi:MAG: M56 family metallopeptidase [Planctomycetes bacterium]|nr:M56 family metallopeptidase [Planctomycetota bacterium]